MLAYATPRACALFACILLGTASPACATTPARVEPARRFPSTTRSWPLPLDVNATFTTSGAETSTIVIHNPDGSTSTAKTTTPTTTTEHAVLRQSTQYYFRVEGGDARCTVAAFRRRAWNGEEEMHALQAAGAQWAEQHLFTPVHEALAERLGSSEEHAPPSGDP